MFRTCLILSILLFAACGVGWVLIALNDINHFDYLWHAGKSRTQWMEMLGDPDPAKRSEAVGAVASFGPRVVPDLVSRLHGASMAVQDSAIEALGLIGEAAIDPIYENHSKYQNGNRDIRIRCERALARIGPAAHPRIRQWLRGQNEADTLMALRVIALMRPPAIELLPDLQPWCREGIHGDGVIPILALFGKEAVDELLLYLHAPSHEVRIQAVLALGSLGVAAHRAAPSLADLADSSDEALAPAARDAFFAIVQ